jgi:hypothetical protein
VLELLKERNFRTVVVIDDENAMPRVDSIESLARELVRAKASRRRFLVSRDNFFADVCELAAPREGLDFEALQADVRAWLEGRELEVTSARLELVSDILLPRVAGPTARKVGGQLDEAYVRLLPFSFGEWQDRQAEILQGASQNERVLLLVDDRNEHEPTVDLDGPRVLRDVLASAAEKLPFIDAIMVTGSCDPASELEKSQELYELVSELLEEGGRSGVFKKVFVFSKERFNGQFVESFNIHLNRIEASRLSIELADATEAVLKNALQDSLDWLKRIPLMEFHHSIFVTAQTEGAAEIDTLIRLASIRQRVALEVLLRQDKNVQTRIEQMRQFTPDGFGGSLPPASTSALRELREQEFERPGSHVNLLRAPIACGDVFTFTAAHAEHARTFTAILLVNPCDLVLRADGTRKLSTGLLVQVEKITWTAATERAKKEVSPLLYRLASGGGSEDIVYVFNNSRIESVPLHVLDLCWSNEDGAASLDPDSVVEAMPTFAAPQRARLKQLSTRADERRFANLELWGTELEPSLKVPDPWQPGTTAVSYPVRREWRLAPEFAAAALSALSQALARPAFGHDYRQH